MRLIRQPFGTGQIMRTDVDLAQFGRNFTIGDDGVHLVLVLGLLGTIVVAIGHRSSGPAVKLMAGRYAADEVIAQKTAREPVGVLAAQERGLRIRFIVDIGQTGIDTIIRALLTPMIRVPVGLRLNLHERSQLRADLLLSCQAVFQLIFMGFVIGLGGRIAIGILGLDPVADLQAMGGQAHDAFGPCAAGSHRK